MQSRSPRSVVAPLWVLAVIATLFFLRAASSLAIPIALAVLVSYALMPLVAWLERHGLPKALAAAVVLLAFVGLLAWSGYALRDDVGTLLGRLPEALERGRRMLQEQLGTAAVMEPSSGPASGSLAQQAASGLFTLAGHVVVIFFLIYFLLISADLVRARIVEAAGPDRQRTAIKIIDDINMQIQRYLLVLLITAAIVAVATWGVLAVMGVEYALMWGVFAGIFNSIPYFGPVIVSGGLFAVGMIQGDVREGLQMATAAIAITSIEGWLITPPLMGKAERMSALAVFLGLLLWTWVWGAWGTILAVPMLVVIKSVADHVGPLKPIGRLLAAER
jgi:predicted PurR-regulated permease PerM